MTPQIHHRNEDPPPTEGFLISKIEVALENVLADLGLESSQPSVKREKYIYLTTREFTEENKYPITYSWFKWGASSLAGPGGASSSKTLVTDPSDSEGLFQAEQEEIEEFLRNGDHELPLEEWWEADFLDFLDHFYSHYGPEEYRDLYLSNIRLLRFIEDIEIAVQHGRNPVIEDTYVELCDITADLRRNVRSLDGVKENHGYLSQFTGILEDVILSMTDFPEEELKKGHQTAISELHDFYQNNVWLMIAHSLSLQSARGPNVDDVYGWSSSNLERLRQEFNDIETKKEICDTMGLLRDFKEYPDFGVTTEFERTDEESASSPLLKQVIEDRDASPEIDQFIEEHGIAKLADLLDLTKEYAEGSMSYRAIANTLSISYDTAYAMIDVLLPLVAEIPEPETIQPNDIDDETRSELLTDTSDV